MKREMNKSELRIEAMSQILCKLHIAVDERDTIKIVNQFMGHLSVENEATGETVQHLNSESSLDNERRIEAKMKARIYEIEAEHNKKIGRYQNKIRRITGSHLDVGFADTGEEINLEYR